jgi:DNA-binding XRE family transcriptional regulator
MVSTVGILSVGRVPGSASSCGTIYLCGALILEDSLIFVNHSIDVFLSFVVGYQHTDNEEVVRIGTQVKKVRERALLTQEELAERAGIGTATLNRIERDRVEPHFRTIRKLAKALGVDPAELLPKE